MDLPVLSQPLPRGFADNLQRPTCDGRHAPADLGVLVGLLLLCLLPRAIVAWRMPAVCNDAVLYIRLADSFRNGNVSEGLHAIRLNLFPILLAGVHCLGFDWELGGKLWGVLISSCTVLPLYGWTRRQFDERVALVTCFLYSIHWELVRWSPEIIRDPTFWFLFTLGLYLLWRAVAEVRLTLFVAAGLAVALASLTRCEGLFLLLPLVLWSITRWQALQQCRCRLAVGVLLCVGAFPMLIAVLALGWLREHALSELVRLEPLSWIYWWAHTGLSPLVGGQDVPIPVLCDATGVISLGRMIEVYVPTLVKGITPVFGLLILAGIGGGWRAVWRRDHRAMLYTTLLFFLAIWIHLWTAHGSCKRYFLTIVVITTPVAAMGLITTTSVLVRMAQRHAWPGGTRALTCCLPLVLITIINLAVALGADCSSRTAEVQVGLWVQRHVGVQATLLGPEGVTQVVSYYARGKCAVFPWSTENETVTALIREVGPDIVLLPARRGPSPSLLQEVQSLGYASIDQSGFAGGCKNVMVLVHDRPKKVVAQQERRRE